MYRFNQQEKTVIGLIPARGGSKGLPKKNLKPLLGKPLIAWSIETALASKYIDEVVVSTDSPEIAEVAKRAGAQVPFLRPAEFAADSSLRSDVIKHALDFYRTEKKREFDYLSFIEPTSPLRDADDLDRAMEQLVANPKAQSIVGISESVGGHPYFTIGMSKEGFLEPYEGFENGRKRRQDIPKLFFYEGSLYISEVKAYLEKEFYHERTLGYVVPKWKSLEIDDIYDFVMVEAVLKHQISMAAQDQK